ncbi:MAG: phosphate ABC transporter substrate-binding protein PstS [Brevinema sp.]
MRTKALSIVLLGTILFFVSCGQESQKFIQGAGATFPAPLYTKLFSDFVEETGVPVNYQAIGSGAGIQNIINGIVDFGASDTFLSDEEIEEYKKEKIEILHIPGALASVNFTYNIPGFGINDTPINLDADIIYGIYSGDIVNWNDERIKEINPTIELPDLEIIPVYRSDSSGTTFTMTEYLSKASKQWEETFGIGKSINWITGVGQKGNSTMMSFTKENLGSIAYVDYVYASQNNFPIAKVKNKAGYFILGNVTNTSAAVANISIPEDNRVSITYADGSNSAPMTTFSYILVRKEQNYNNRTLSQAQTLVKLLLWLDNPKIQARHEALFFSPMPQSLLGVQKNIIKQITYNGQPVVDTLNIKE